MEKIPVRLVTDIVVAWAQMKIEIENILINYFYTFVLLPCVLCKYILRLLGGERVTVPANRLGNEMFSLVDHTNR